MYVLRRLAWPDVTVEKDYFTPIPLSVMALIYYLVNSNGVKRSGYYVHTATYFLEMCVPYVNQVIDGFLLVVHKKLIIIWCITYVNLKK